MKTLSIDIGGTKIAAALVDKDFSLDQEYKVETPKRLDHPSFTQTLKAVIDNFNPEDYHAVAVCTAGVVYQGQLTALTPGNIGGMLHYPMVAEISKLCAGKEVHCLNDAQAAAYAEYKIANQQKGLKDICFITVSTGVGGGLVINNQLLVGQTNLAGHLGHTSVSFNGPQCPCGRIGCVEAFASGKSIERETSGWANPASTKEVFDLWREGDVKAATLIEQSALAISQLIADMVVTTDIKHYSVGGSVGLADGYLELVRTYNKKLPEHFRADIFPAYFASNAGMVGVMANYWDSK